LSTLESFKKFNDRH